MSYLWLSRLLGHKSGGCVTVTVRHGTLLPRCPPSLSGSRSWWQPGYLIWECHTVEETGATTRQPNGQGLGKGTLLIVLTLSLRPTQPHQGGEHRYASPFLAHLPCVLTSTQRPCQFQMRRLRLNHGLA